MNKAIVRHIIVNRALYGGKPWVDRQIEKSLRKYRLAAKGINGAIRSMLLAVKCS